MLRISQRAVRLVISWTLWVPGIAIAASVEPAAQLACGATGNDQVREARTLFLRLPGSASERSLEFRVQFEGRPFLTETIQVGASGQKAIDIELLARAPQALERLFRLAEKAPNEVSIAIRTNGDETLALSLSELVKRSDLLVEAQDFSPRANPSEIADFAPPLAAAPDLTKIIGNLVGPDPLCEQGCNDAYILCFYDYCDQRGDCSYCYRDYQWCVAGCPTVCTDPKSVTEFTEVVRVSATLTGASVCLRDPLPPNPKKVHLDARITHKNTRIRRTEYCNGTHSDQILSVDYFTFPCLYRTVNNCSPSVGASGNLCPL